ncbi:MAG: NYN domain-containing protein, partial [Chloroflexi bacterium]|nr:NYN domain-containing protein [Chloroflexota bacterium]
MPTSAKPSDAQHQERIMVFIDGSNLYHVLGEVCGRHDLNFGKFAEKIAGDRDLVRTYYYNIRQDSERDPNVATEQGKFLQTMYDTPYLEVRMGVSKRHGETMVEKGVDVFMATDLVAFAFMDLYDTAIVVSGDGDFFPAIQTAKNQGKHIEVAAFDNNLSSEAGNVADAVIKLNKTYFTGLWSDRRRRATTGSSSSSSAPARRTRTTRSSSSSRPVSSRATTPEPEVAEESTTEDSGRRTTTRRRPAASRSTSRTSGSRTTGSRTTTRRRTPTRRTASSTVSDSNSAPETAVTSTPAPESAPEPAPTASNG